MTSRSQSTARSSIAAGFFALLAMTALSSAQSDASLSGLVPSAGTLAPVFDSGTINYTASVPNATTDITVTPTATDPNATITVNTIPVASGNPSGAISLSVGANVITTVVVSQDTSSTITYTLTVTRTPNVDLSGLTPSAGTLIPAFAGGTISYNAAVPTATTDITVTPTAVNPSATITVNGSPVTSGSPSGAIALSAGSNTITTVVTGEDAVTTKTYTLTVIRGPKTLFSSGGKTWDTTTANWGLVTAGPFNTAIWSNSDGGDSATLQGTAGTVTLGGPISLKNLTFTHTTATYTITGSSLNFTSGTITASNPPNTSTVNAIIQSNITGSPAISLTPMDGDDQFTLNPAASGSMSIGTVTGSGALGSEKLNLQGGAGSSGTIADANGVKVLVTSGAWTLNGNGSFGYGHAISAGTLTLNANLNATHRGVNLSGTGVLNYNVAGAVSATAATNASTDNGLRITGGTLDQTSGAAINSNTSTTHIDLAGTLTFAGTNGALSNLHLGSGPVWLKDGNRQITVTNAATTLTIGGVIQNDDVAGRSLTKAGAGTLELRGVNTYTGTTTVNAGTLKMGANNVIPDASNVTIGTATLDADTRTDTAGTLDVTGTAVINLGSGAALAFADSKAVDWTGGTLNITGTLGATSLRFGDSADDLTSGPSGQLAKISVNGSGLGTYVLDANGYLVPGGGLTAYETWAGGALFDQDANNDGVKNGLAFLLGAASPTSAVTPPTVTRSGGDLILNFNCLPDSARGNATLRVEHSSDLGVLDPWTATTAEVPDATNAVPDNNVTFVVAAGPVGPPALNSVTATIDSAAAAGGKLFGRLKAVETP